MTEESLNIQSEEDEAISKANRLERVKEKMKTSPSGSKIVPIVATGILGAAIGVAGGMVLVATAAAMEGAVLSVAVFAKVLGLAGAAGGVSHSIVSQKNKR